MKFSSSFTLFLVSLCFFSGMNLNLKQVFINSIFFLIDIRIITGKQYENSCGLSASQQRRKTSFDIFYPDNKFKWNFF